MPASSCGASEAARIEFAICPVHSTSLVRFPAQDVYFVNQYKPVFVGTPMLLSFKKPIITFKQLYDEVTHPLSLTLESFFGIVMFWVVILED